MTLCPSNVYNDCWMVWPCSGCRMAFSHLQRERHTRNTSVLNWFPVDTGAECKREVWDDYRSNQSAFWMDGGLMAQHSNIECIALQVHFSLPLLMTTFKGGVKYRPSYWVLHCTFDTHTHLIVLLCKEGHARWILGFGKFQKLLDAAFLILALRQCSSTSLEACTPLVLVSLRLDWLI